MNASKLFALAVASGALFLASASTPAAADIPGSIVIVGFTFVPPVAVVTDGVVTFTNNDIVAHLPHSHHALDGVSLDPVGVDVNEVAHPDPDGCFSGGVINPGQTVNVAITCLDEVIAYHCDIHPFMRGVIVTDEP